MNRDSSFLISSLPRASAIAPSASLAEPARAAAADSVSEAATRATPSQTPDWAAPCAAARSIRKGLVAGVAAAAALLALGQSLSARAEPATSAACATTACANAR